MARPLILVLLIACKAGEPTGQPAAIVDVSSSLEPLRRDFEAHRGEARFLTLLSPS